MKNVPAYFINSVSELHSFLNLRKPTHPLISVINLEEISLEVPKEKHTIVYDFYTIYLKKNFDGRIRYGQQYLDFQDGIMSFFAPKQGFIVEAGSSTKSEGWMVVLHPNFIQGFPLAKKIKDYGFFSYDIKEALHCSESEEIVLSGIMANLSIEIEKMIDNYTQEVLISHIELLLSYCNRFYNRQFITRKISNKEILGKLDRLLNELLDNDTAGNGIPTVQMVALQLNISPNYLSDMLRSYTGQNTQQHIHSKVIEKAKELLSGTELTVAEIAYQLGFERPQSLHKLFKSKTDMSPLKFRQSYN